MYNFSSGWRLSPFRRPGALAVFLSGTDITIYLGSGAALPIDKSLTLGLF